MGIRPQTAQFKDLLAALHLPSGASSVICGICLVAADMVFSGNGGRLLTPGSKPSSTGAIVV
jgi:LSD1 subclass zinc finger protein